MEDNSQNWLSYRTFHRRSSANSYPSFRLSSLSPTSMPLLKTVANYILDWENFACIPVAGQGHQSCSQQTKVIRSPSPALSGGHTVLWLPLIHMMNKHSEEGLQNYGGLLHPQSSWMGWNWKLFVHGAPAGAIGVCNTLASKWANYEALHCECRFLLVAM